MMVMNEGQSPMNPISDLIAAYQAQRADPSAGPPFGEYGDGLVDFIRQIDDYADDDHQRVLAFYLVECQGLIGE